MRPLSAVRTLVPPRPRPVLASPLGIIGAPQACPLTGDREMQFANTITAVDTHVCGEPGRVIVGGVLDVPGRTMFEKRLYLEEHADALRKRMLREPRGYPAANCNLILPPTHPEAQAGY